jgi:hypothetical protein
MFRIIVSFTKPSVGIRHEDESKRHLNRDYDQLRVQHDDRTSDVPCDGKCWIQILLPVHRMLPISLAFHDSSRSKLILMLFTQVCNLTNAIFFWLFLPETARLPLEEMNYLFTHSPWVIPGSKKTEYISHDLETRAAELSRKGATVDDAEVKAE